MKMKKVFHSVLMIMLSIAIMWNFSWLPKPVVKADDNATNGIRLSMSSNVATVESGKIFTYEVKFSFSDLGVHNFDFSNMKLILPIPEDIVYVGYEPISIISNGALVGNDAIFSFSPSGPNPGESYTMQVNVKFKPYITLNGTSATTSPYIVDGNNDIIETANDVTVIATASSLWHLEKQRTSPIPTPMVDGNVQYEILFDNDKSVDEIGVLDIENVVLTDTLPAGSVFVSASNGGTLEPGNTVVWTIPGTLREDTRFYVTVNYPSPTFDISSLVVNYAHVEYSDIGNATRKTDDAQTGHGFIDYPDDAGLNGIFHKDTFERHQEISPGQDVRFDIGGFRNRSNGYLENASIVDLTPTVDSSGNLVNLNLKSIQTATFFDSPSVTYSVYYATSPAADDWTLWQDVSSTTPVTLEAADLSLGAKITGIKFNFPGLLPISFSQLTEFQLTYTLDGGAVTNGNWIENIADLYYTFDGGLKAFHDPARVYLWGNRPLVRLHKDLIGPDSYSPGQEIEFEITVENTDLSSDELNNPVVMDVLPSSLTYDRPIDVGTSYMPVYSSSGFANVGTLQLVDKETLGNGDTLLRWEFENSVSMDPNEHFTIRYKAKVNDFAPPGTYDNWAEFTTSADPYFNDYYFDTQPDTDNHDKNAATNKLIRSRAQFAVNTVAALGSYKRVRGELDGDGWKTGLLPPSWKDGDPIPPVNDLGKTVAGGRVDYKLTVYNKGNVSLDNIVLVDVLPRVGDEGALLGSRGSTWGTVLTESLSNTAEYTVLYSTDEHPKMDAGTTWLPTAPADLTTVTALKFVFDPSLELAPDEERNIVWSMKAPVGTLEDKVAWNSFGQQASKVGGSALEPAEPPKVGVHIAPDSGLSIGDYVWVDLDKNGIQDEDLQLWGVNGVLVELLKDDGTAFTKDYDDDGTIVHIPVTTVTGDDDQGRPGFYLFPNLPAGDYKVRFTMPSNLPVDYEYDYGINTANKFSTWTQMNALGSNEENDTNVGGAAPVVVTDTITLPSSYPDGYDLTIDAGLLPPLGAIGDYVWRDVDKSGTQTAGDSPVAGVVVKLLYENGDPVLDGVGDPREETTDAAGKYEFTGLLPGKYRVEFPQEIATGEIVTFVRQGSDRKIDSNPNALGMSDVITLQLGEVNHTVDAGYVMPVEIGNYVWEDSNYDGVQDSGEPGMPNIVVNLLDTSNTPVKEANGTTNRTKTTDIDGEYKFDKLLPGTYRVEFVLPDTDHGFTRKGQGGDATLDSNVNRSDDIAATPQTSGRTDNIAVTTPGASDMTIDAGIVKLVSLGDKVWRDNDRNGVQDAGEPGVEDVTVTLYYDDVSTSVVYRTATTSANGSYTFTKLYPGRYTVQFERPDGYVYTNKGDGTQSAIDSNVNKPILDSDPIAKTDQIDLGSDNDSVDAGLVPLASLGDIVWLDTNANGIKDGVEAGLDGAKVELFNHDGSAKITVNAYGDAIADITTDATGAYLFDKLNAGTYVVKFTLPNGYTFTAPNVGDDADDSDAIVDTGAPSNGATGPIVLDAGEHDPTIDAGALAYASLGDLIWHDTNGNGIQDGAESGVPNVTVRLYESDGTTEVANDAYNNPISPATTDADGKYSFTNLPPGNYKVKFDLPAPYTDFTSANAAGSTEMNDSDVDDNGWTDTITLTWNMNNPNVDAGVVEITSLGDLLWYDVNGNGVQDPDELGVPNVKVELYDAADLDTVLKSMPTDNDGKYLFDGLWPGSYVIKFYLPSDYYFFSPRFNSADSSEDSNADPAIGANFGMTEQISIVSTGSNLTLDAGIVELASLGDTLWNDTAYDGILNSENGYPGVTVHLLNNAGLPVLKSGVPVTTTTDANGNYLFEKLVPGDYRVKFDLPAGFIFTHKQAAGSTNANDSDVDTVTGITDTITLLPGTHNMNVDAGIVKLASLGDRVWMDKTPGGTQNVEELGVSGVNVQVLDELGNAATDAIGNPLIMQTDMDGKYRFDNLIPGKYIVEFDLPTGYVFVEKNQGADTAADSNVIPSGANERKTDVITLQPGEVNLTIDAGLIQLVRLGDLLWVDTDIIGGQDGEAADPAASGVTVHLLDNSGAPVLNGGTPVTTTTDANGNYLFTNLLPGQYQVQFDLPTGYLFTRQKITTNGVTVATDSDVDASGKTGTIMLVAGEDNLTIDAGIALPASLGDYVWVDGNGNGVQDASEQGFNNVKVDLYDDENVLLLSTTTADNAGNAGYYEFTNLVPGAYKVKFTLPSGYMATVKRAGGNTALDSDIDNAGWTEAVTLLPGTHNPDLDAGIRLIPPTPTSELGNYVWIDLNENGIQDADEQGLNGVIVELYNRYDALIGTQTTANGPDGKAGYYKFQSLQPDDYKIKVILPNGYAFTLKNEGTDRAKDSKTDSDGLMDKITLFGGDYRQDQDAGLVPLSSLGDYVWIDSNKNGIQDAGEKGQNGIVVTLLNESGTAIATALTDTNAGGNPGYYLFEGLKSGKYSVRFDLPVGFAFTTQGSSGSAANDSNADAAGKTGLVTLKAGASDLTIDVGLVLLEKKPEKPEKPENPENPEGPKESTPPTTGTGNEPGNGGNAGAGANPGNSATPPANGGGKNGNNNAAAPAGQGRDGKSNTGALPKTGENMPVLPFIGFGLAAIAAVLLIARRMSAKK